MRSNSASSSSAYTSTWCSELRPSALQIRLDQLVELLDRHGAALDLAVDEEGRGGVHAELLRPAVAHRVDAVEHLLVGEAGLETLLGEAVLLGDPEQRLERLLHHPVLLLGEQRVDQGVVL